jgi:hypothetical protein
MGKKAPTACGQDCPALGPAQALFYAIFQNASAATAASATAKLMSRGGTADTAAATANTNKDALIVAKIDSQTLTKFLGRIHGLVEKGPKHLMLGPEPEKPPATPSTPAMRIGGSEVLLLGGGDGMGPLGPDGMPSPSAFASALPAPMSPSGREKKLTRKVAILPPIRPFVCPAVSTTSIL